MEERLLYAGIPFERFPGVDAERYAKKFRKGGEVRGYSSPGRYALALTQRLALREARRRRAPSVLLLEDDVVFHPAFEHLIKAVDLPESWGIFYLGCAHSRKAEWAGNRVVRVSHAVDTHAVAVKAEYYGEVMDAWNRHGKEPWLGAKASDQFLTHLSSVIPTFACYPNLAWQAVETSDLTGTRYSNYHQDGGQKHWTSTVEHLLPELVQNVRAEPTEVFHESTARLGLLFLVRDDVNHPDIWHEFVSEAPDRVRIFAHRKNRSICTLSNAENMRFLAGTDIREWFDTQWGDISLVKATRAMMLEALEDETLTHFALVSESCVPVMSLPEILRRLEIDPRSRFRSKSFEKTSDRNRSRVGAVPQVPLGCWRFQSQWWLMNRSAAYFSAVPDFTKMFEHMFAPDESYFATVLAMQGYPVESEVVSGVSTWTWWEKNAGHPNSWPEIPKNKLREILHSGAMFARKFPKKADIGKFALHRSPLPNNVSTSESIFA